MTALPAAVRGRPARVRCQSRRALGLRVVPLRCPILPTEAAPLSDVGRRMRDAYADGGRVMLAWELREVIREATHARAVNVDERAALLAWARYAYVDALPSWLTTAAAEGWARPDWH